MICGVCGVEKKRYWLDDYFILICDCNKHKIMNYKNEKEYKEGAFKFGDCIVIVSRENGDRWHLSISHQNRLPTYEELKNARYTFTPDYIYMAQIFPPKKQFINLHPYCLHLYQI